MNYEELAELGKRNDAWNAKRLTYDLIVFNARNERIANRAVVMTVIGMRRALKKLLTDTPNSDHAKAYFYGTDSLVDKNIQHTVR